MMSLWKGEIDAPPVRPNARQIIAGVAARHGFGLDELVGPSRRQALAHARQEAMWELRQRTGHSLPRIGMFLGGRDHTTILHGIRRHQARIDAGGA